MSRHTVRQALRQLRADGVIVAERGRQPRVAPPRRDRPAAGALYSLFASVEAAGLSQHSVVRTFDVRADALVAERLELEASTPLVYLERLRLAGDEPLALDRVWLPADLAKPLLHADFTHTGLYAELPRRTGSGSTAAGKRSTRSSRPRPNAPSSPARPTSRRFRSTGSATPAAARWSGGTPWSAATASR